MNHRREHIKSSLLDFSKLEELRAEAATEVRESVWSLLSRSESGADHHRTPVSTHGLTVGRHPQNELCVTDVTVSGRHAQLFCIQNDLFVKDLGSTNGTLLNGRRIRSMEMLRDGDVIHFGQVKFSVEQVVRKQTRHEDFTTKTCVATVPEDAILYKAFDRLINRPDIEPYFQPLVTLKNTSTIGYEVLVRSRIKGLETPDKIFRIASMRLSEARLSEICRSEGLLNGIQLNPNMRYFVNTHAKELETPRLISSLFELRDLFPTIPVVLEVHEAAIASVKYLRELMAVLNELNIELAYDDFGAGQARLVELFQVPPRYLKFDISLVRGLEGATPQHHSSIRSLLNMVHDLNVLALAEGVETAPQAEICAELGFDLAQGYYFGRPQPRDFWSTAPTLGGDVTQSIATA